MLRSCDRSAVCPRAWPCWGLGCASSAWNTGVYLLSTLGRGGAWGGLSKRVGGGVAGFPGTYSKHLGWCFSLRVLVSDGVIVSDIFPGCGDRLAAVLASGP